MVRQRTPDPVKFCEHCGKQLTRKRINGRLEDSSVFKRRKYCDQTCMGLGRQKFDAGDSALHKRAVKHRKSICESCGTAENLQCHHKDGDPSNNDPSNIQTLCGSCHTRLHWQHGKSIPVQFSVCIICGKQQRHLRGGLCQKHWQRYKKYGDPYLVKRRHGSSFVLVRSED